MVLEDTQPEIQSPGIQTEDAADDLVDRCRLRDDPATFRALFELYKDKVFSIALRYSGDAAIAQDIAQETFLKLYASLGSYRREASFDSWLYRLVVNACFDEKRKTRRLMPLVDGFLDLLRAPGVTALDEMLRAEMTGQLRAVVESLPPEQRMVIVLRYTEGLSYERIGAILGCPSGTVASRLNRVHRVLERRLSRLVKKGMAHV